MEHGKESGRRKGHVSNLRVIHRRSGRGGADFGGVGAFAAGVGGGDDVIISVAGDDIGIGVTQGGGADQGRVRPAAGR